MGHRPDHSARAASSRSDTRRRPGRRRSPRSGCWCAPIPTSWQRPPASGCCCSPASPPTGRSGARMRYETWWVVHLYLYIGLALAFAHQIVTGVTFIGHPLARALWIAIWASTAGLVLAFRVGQPAWRSLRHQLRVVEVRDEAPGVVSVICRGRHLDKLRGVRRPVLPLAIPDQGAVVAGAPVLAVRAAAAAVPARHGEGPRRLRAAPCRMCGQAPGSHSRARTVRLPTTPGSSDGVLLIAAGVGVTPLRALLEDLPAHADVVVIIRASTVADIVHRDEIVRTGRVPWRTAPRDDRVAPQAPPQRPHASPSRARCRLTATSTSAAPQDLTPR